MTALTLYELKGEWRELADKLSDMDLDPQTVADTIEGSDIQIALEEKVQGYEMVARSFEAPIHAIDAEIKRLHALKKASQNRADTLRNRVHQAMRELEIDKIKCPLFEVRRQKNPPSVEVYNADLVPFEFWKTPEPEIDKAGLKAALQAGKEIEGARLTQSEGLRIK